MKTSIFTFLKNISSISNSRFGLSFAIFLFTINYTALSQNHCLIIKNIGINTVGGAQSPYCDGSNLDGCKASEFIELFNTCDAFQNFSCYIICDGDWCVRIPSDLPDLPPSGTIALGSKFSSGFDADNPFHIDIHNCNNCVWSNIDGGSSFEDLGILNNTGEQVALFDSNGNLEMGLFWGGGEGTFGDLDLVIEDTCPNQNLTLNFPDPTVSPQYIDLADLATTDACAITIPNIVIHDNSVTSGTPEALCTSNNENSGIGGSNPFTQIGPINSDNCFYSENETILEPYYEPQVTPEPEIVWSSSTGVLFDSPIGLVNSIIYPFAEAYFPSAGNHSVTIGLLSPEDGYTYYYTENFTVEENIDLSNLNACVGSEFTINSVPNGFSFVAAAITDASGLPVIAPQNQLPLVFNIPNTFTPGNYSIRFIGASCTLDVPFEISPAGECTINCSDPCFLEYDPAATETYDCLTDITSYPPNINIPDAVCNIDIGFTIDDQLATYVWYSDMELTNQVYSGGNFNPFTDGMMMDIPGTVQSFWVVNTINSDCQSPTTEVVFRIKDDTVRGCTDANACNYDASACIDDGSCLMSGCNPGCTRPCALNYDPRADEDDGSCISYSFSCNTDCTIGPIERWDTVFCNCEDDLLIVEGCLEACALNYNPEANLSCGDCEYPSCDDMDSSTIDTFDTITCDCVNTPDPALSIEDCEGVCGKATFNITGLYPIPTSDFITLQFVAPVQNTIDIVLFDLIGQTLSIHQKTSHTGINQTEINVENLSAGVYFISIISDNNKVTQKFIVE